MKTKTQLQPNIQNEFPPFNLLRLLQTVFDLKKGERIAILTDLEKPSDVVHFSFLKKSGLSIQKKAHDVIYKGIHDEIMPQLSLGACDFFAYQITGGSNLELPNHAIKSDGKEMRLDPDLYSSYDIIICVGSYSATAPLTAAAKRFGFRGATMHGMNDIILKSGLAVDYNQVSKMTEKLRLGMTQADSVSIDFEVKGHESHLQVELGKQEAQKSHGICREKGEIANLPAGEVYFVPRDATGSFPIKFEEDGTLALMEVAQGKVKKITLLDGSQETVNKYQNKFKRDPSASILGELGFGTQRLPYSGADIQDEKIFGTFHLATGRNDHLQGNVTKERFHDLRNATHDDILFSSTKTPEIHVKQVRMKRNGKEEILIEDYQPSPYLLNLLKNASFE